MCPRVMFILLICPFCTRVGAFRWLLPLVVVGCCSFSASSQNTFQGQARRVPEEEVNRQSSFVEAERERLLGHYDKSAQKYKQFIDKYGDEPAAWYGLARALQAKGDAQGALDAAAKAVGLDAANEWYKILLADIYESLGQSADAVKVYSALCKQSPQNIRFLDKLAHLQVLAGRPKEALKTLEQLEKITGVTEATADKKHLIYLGLGDVKKAVGELQKLVNAYPARVVYRHRIAQVYESVGDKAAAQKVYEEILRIAPNDEAAKLALLAERRGSSGSVLSELRTLKPIVEDPKVSIDGKVKQVLPYFKQMEQDMPAEAIALLLELGDVLVKVHPDEAKAWSLSGDLYYHADRYDEALERYRRCLELGPRIFSVWANTLEILYLQRRFDELLRFSERAMDDFPNQPVAYYYYGVAALEQGRPEEALPQLEQAGIMVVNNPALSLDIADQVGRALLMKKDYGAARRHYEALLKQGGEQHPGILEHYGDVLYQSGQQQQAVEFWQRAARLLPSPRLEQKIRERRL